jgi:hypothetical protein
VCAADGIRRTHIHHLRLRSAAGAGQSGKERNKSPYLFSPEVAKDEYNYLY